MDNYNTHAHENYPEPTAKDYILFASILVFILLVSLYWEYSKGFEGLDFLRVFMGVFFLVFAVFKLADLKGFVMSYIGYDIIAARFTAYAYVYPFLELALALSYFFHVQYTDVATIILMTVGAIGVTKQLLRGSKIKCACLGKYVNLPLTTVSLVEDLAMGVMALVLLVARF